MTRREKGWLVALAGTIVLAAAYRAGPFWQQWQSCAIGYSGSEATVVVWGRRANEFCAGMVDGYGRYYLRSAPVTEPVLCEYGGSSGRHYVVHDVSSPYGSFGGHICQQLRSGTFRPGA
jgi:hypothetical protein